MPTLHIESCALLQVIAAGMNPVQIARGIEKTSKALLSELKLTSREVYKLISSVNLSLDIENFEKFVSVNY